MPTHNDEREIVVHRRQKLYLKAYLIGKNDHFASHSHWWYLEYPGNLRQYDLKMENVRTGHLK